MRREGTTALIDRVEAIAGDLVESGRIDGDSRVNETLKTIDREAQRLQSWPGDEHPDNYRPQPEPSVFGSQISYLHNEFNLDEARPLGGLALVTHFSMIPIYPPLAFKEPRVELGLRTLEVETISQTFINRFETLRRKTIHSIPAEGFEGFIGTNDDVMNRTTRFHSYKQPVITTMRSIERLADRLAKHFGDTTDPLQRSATEIAERANAEALDQMRKHGVSSRLSMVRDYTLLQSPSGIGQLHFTWHRHHDHYQTITVTEHADPAAYESGSGFSAEDRAALPTLAELADVIRYRQPASALIDRTALDSFPREWAGHLYGRYLQGANYLVLPIEWLFDPEHLDSAVGDRVSPNIRSEPWFDLCARVMGMHDIAHECDKGVHIRAADFRACWFASKGDEAKLRAASELAMRLVRPFIRRYFGNDPDSRYEIVMSGLAHGAAILITDARNFGRSGERHLMSTSIILDLGMNEFERGRLLKHLSAFSTQRFLTLTTLRTFRFFSGALDVLNGRLVQAANTWDGKEKEAIEAENPETPRRDRPVADAKRHDVFIKTLQGIVIDLTMMHTLTHGGITAQVAASQAAQQQVLAHIANTGHYPLPGFMGMEEFLGRRYRNSIDVMEMVGNRYELLRTRIAELSALVQARIQNEQAEKQISQTEAIDRLTAFGIIYYFGQITAYIILAVAIAFSIHYAVSDTKEATKSLHDGLLTYAKVGLYPLAILLAAVFGFNAGFKWMEDVRRKHLNREFFQRVVVIVFIASVAFILFQWWNPILGFLDTLWKFVRSIPDIARNYRWDPWP